MVWFIHSYYMVLLSGLILWIICIFSFYIIANLACHNLYFPLRKIMCAYLHKICFYLCWWTVTTTVKSEAGCMWVSPWLCWIKGSMLLQMFHFTQLWLIQNCGINWMLYLKFHGVIISICSIILGIIFLK